RGRGQGSTPRTGPRLACPSRARSLLNVGHIYERAGHEHRRQATETIQSVPKLAADGRDLFHRSDSYLAAGVRQLGRSLALSPCSTRWGLNSRVRIGATDSADSASAKYYKLSPEPRSF